MDPGPPPAPELKPLEEVPEKPREDLRTRALRELREKEEAKPLGLMIEGSGGERAEIEGLGEWGVRVFDKLFIKHIGADFAKPGTDETVIGMVPAGTKLTIDRLDSMRRLIYAQSQEDERAIAEGIINARMLSPVSVRLSTSRREVTHAELVSARSELLRKGCPSEFLDIGADPSGLMAWAKANAKDLLDINIASPGSRPTPTGNVMVVGTVRAGTEMTLDLYQRLHKQVEKSWAPMPFDQLERRRAMDEVNDTFNRIGALRMARMGQPCPGCGCSEEGTHAAGCCTMTKPSAQAVDLDDYELTEVREKAVQLAIASLGDLAKHAPPQDVVARAEVFEAYLLRDRHVGEEN